MILKDSTLASLGKYSGGQCQEWKNYHNYLCSYLLEKGCFTLKKGILNTTGLNFVSENILTAPINDSDLTAAYNSSLDQLLWNCSKIHTVQIWPRRNYVGESESRTWLGGCRQVFVTVFWALRPQGLLWAMLVDAPGLFMTTGGELGPLGMGLLYKLLLSGLHVHPVVLIPVPPTSMFTLLRPNMSPLHIPLSQSVWLVASLNVVLSFFSVEVTLP